MTPIEQAKAFLEWVDRGHAGDPLRPDLPPDWVIHMTALARLAPELWDVLDSIEMRGSWPFTKFKRTCTNLPTDDKLREVGFLMNEMAQVNAKLRVDVNMLLDEVRALQKALKVKP